MTRRSTLAVIALAAAALSVVGGFFGNVWIAVIGGGACGTTLAFMCEAPR